LIDSITTAMLVALRPLLYVFSNQLALDFLFGGKVDAGHKTKFAIERFVGRYAESIESLNRALIVSVAFVPIALLPVGETIKIPLVDVQVTNQNWLRVCPAISYGLQVFTLVALSWFLLMRRGLAILKSEVGQVDHFGDVSNVMLTGILGSLWMVLNVRKHFPSKLHLIWFLPLVVLFLAVILSPSILCAYFVWGLFVLKDFAPAFIYSAFLVPSIALSMVLIALSVVAALPETWMKTNAT